MAETDENKPKWREWLAPLFGNEKPEQEPDSEIFRLVKDAASRELFDEDTVKIIYGALQVSNMQARDIMVPRSNMVFLRSSNSLEEILDTFKESPHSRFPVCGEDIDDIRGILHAKDLIDSVLIDTRQNGLDLDELIRPAKIIPESKRLNLLLKDFRNERQHMALVIDEFSHVAGLITIEDVLSKLWEKSKTNTILPTTKISSFSSTTDPTESKAKHRSTNSTNSLNLNCLPKNSTPSAESLLIA